MTELLKLEKQWKKFLANDGEASCSLKPMQRPLRKFVHEYSDFWRLHTESFDPEGRRYIYCAKLADTCAPHPLLSEAVRKWRGPSSSAIATAGLSEAMPINLPTGPALRPSSTTTVAVPPPTTLDGWRTEQRVPLKLVPRTVVDITKSPLPLASFAPASSTSSGMTRSISTPVLLSMTGEGPPPPRFADLCNKERPKLQLAKRSIPTWDELEKRHISQEEWNNNMIYPPDRQEAILREIEEENVQRQVVEQREREREDARIHRLEVKAKKKVELMVKKKAILESAFASSSDDDGGSSDSDWFEGDLEFDGSDDEGM